jgi:hypothetical protein
VLRVSGQGAKGLRGIWEFASFWGGSFISNLVKNRKRRSRCSKNERKFQIFVNNFHFSAAK